MESSHKKYQSILKQLLVIIIMKIAHLFSLAAAMAAAPISSAQERVLRGMARRRQAAVQQRELMHLVSFCSNI